MKPKRGLLFTGIVATLGAFTCFSLMETVPDFSPTSNALNAGGYILVALALVVFVMAFGSVRR